MGEPAVREKAKIRGTDGVFSRAPRTAELVFVGVFRYERKKFRPGVPGKAKDARTILKGPCPFFYVSSKLSQERNSCAAATLLVLKRREAPQEGQKTRTPSSVISTSYTPP